VDTVLLFFVYVLMSVVIQPFLAAKSNKGYVIMSTRSEKRLVFGSRTKPGNYCNCSAKDICDMEDCTQRIRLETPFHARHLANKGQGKLPPPNYLFAPINLFDKIFVDIVCD